MRSVKPVLHTNDATGKTIHQFDLKNNTRKLGTILMSEFVNGADVGASGTMGSENKVELVDKIILTEKNFQNEINNQEITQDIMEKDKDKDSFENTLHGISPGGYPTDHMDINEDIK